MAQLPDNVLNMNMEEFIDSCEDAEFNRRYNVPFVLQDPENLLGLESSEDDEESEQSHEAVASKGDQQMKDEEVQPPQPELKNFEC